MGFSLQCVGVVCLTVAAIAAEQLCAVGVPGRSYYTMRLCFYSSRCCNPVSVTTALHYTANNFRLMYSQNRSSKASFPNVNKIFAVRIIFSFVNYDIL
jgi:hypothetical protein